MLAQRLILAMYYMTQFFQYAILAHVILSWFSRPGGATYKFFLALTSFLDPIYRPFRRISARFIPKTGVDFTPFLAMIAVSVFYRLFIIVIRFTLMG